MEGYMTIAQHEEYAKRMEEEHKRQNRRIEEVEKDCKENNRLLITVEKLAMCMDNMQKEQKLQREQLEKQNDELEELKNRDGEKWRDISRYVLVTIVGIFIGFIAKNLGF